MKWGLRTFGGGVGTRLVNILLQCFLQDIHAGKGSQTEFGTLSPKVRLPHFLGFGLPELLLKKAKKKSKHLPKVSQHLAKYLKLQRVTI